MPSHPDNGGLSPEKERRVSALYDAAQEPEGNPGRFPEAPPEVRLPVQDADPITAVATLLAQRLSQSTRVVELQVNGVGFEMPVIDVQISEHSICCLLRDIGWKCRIPATRDILLTFEGREHKVAFLGAWHKFDWLGIHLLFFPVMPVEDEG